MFCLKILAKTIDFGTGTLGVMRLQRLFRLREGEEWAAFQKRAEEETDPDTRAVFVLYVRPDALAFPDAPRFLQETLSEKLRGRHVSVTYLCDPPCDAIDGHYFQVTVEMNGRPRGHQRALSVITPKVGEVLKEARQKTVQESA